MYFCSKEDGGLYDSPSQINFKWVTIIVHKESWPKNANGELQTGIAMLCRADDGWGARPAMHILNNGFSCISDKLIGKDKINHHHFCLMDVLTSADLTDIFPFTYHIGKLQFANARPINLANL